MKTDLENPLLDGGLPAFSKIRPEHALPALEKRLADYLEVIERIESLDKEVDYGNVVVAETLADNALANTWSAISHLHAVINTPEWRDAYQACLAPMTRFHTERGQNRKLWAAYKALAEREDFVTQDAALRATVEHELRNFHLAGVDLPESERKRFGETSLRLSELGNRFGNHVLDATEAYSETFDEAEQLAGLPESELELLAGMARDAGQDGWMANLSFPAYRAVITYADDRDLRQRFHRAFATRASETGPQGGQFDNGPVMREMLALRDEQARLLDFEHHAAMRLSTRMADTAEEVEGFLNHLAERARPQAKAQLEELNGFAGDLGAETPLEPWDIAYYSEKLREQKLGINESMLKPWFELQRVFDGLFTTAGELFGLRFEADERIDTWHEDVHFFHVLDESGEKTAGLYLDLYSRPRKSGGAWMDVCRARMRVGGIEQLPIAYLTCNFAPPGQDQPSLLTHDDVVTLFHEFGHCLHHLLTRIDLPGVAGINGVEWDAVELPSQLMEGWAWEAESLERYARHVDTGEPLPEEMLAGLKANQQFLGAMALVRQIEFALCDLALHTRPGADPIDVMHEVNDRIAVLPMPAYNRFLMSFSHLFDGGYAAGYYSYLWAELLARDAFDLFRDKGLFDSDTGHRLAREILEVGSSRPMQDSWLAFRGREPALEPLLASYGIAA
ncbi:M3 family metallopeptidase [Wenzhouxiangella sp. XN201]|uniref:M3 family metallopeptidase n=1 Tax=Wenzhouxiangella sp. XN201 TaxID=2710755 RepID=UPI0013C5716C|nr:M3 family metallopeptidase [Wenzhouxiangella sp. XN201]NEZ03216.1 M3 family metallopeptidase [Wenzhouxiangella sp. XN201]